MVDRPTVRVVGLGPAKADLIGSGTWAVLQVGPTVVRTARHPAAAALGEVDSLDYLYETAEDFETLYATMVEELVGRAQRLGQLVYAVPGSPSVAERTVELLRADDRVEVVIEPAVSFVDLAWLALGVDPIAAAVRIVDGADLPTLGMGGAVLVAQCWNRQILSDIKLLADGAHRVVLLHHLGLDDAVVAEVAWEEIDRTLEPDHLTSLYIEGLSRGLVEQTMALDQLTRTLRTQCPWDREQTHASLAKHLLEETYELLEAIDLVSAAQVGSADDALATAALAEELGDVAFQVFFHATLAEEEARFDLAEVFQKVHTKLVGRHPHVFASTEVSSAREVETNWDEIKKIEKGRTSVIEGIPMALPALALAAKLGRKARGVGLDPDAGLDSIAERLSALSDDPDTAVAGDVLFDLCTRLSQLGVEPESALRAAAMRWVERIRAEESDELEP